MRASQVTFDEAALEHACIRVLQGADLGDHTAPTPGSLERSALVSTMAAVGWMYMDLPRAVLEIESVIRTADGDGKIPGVPGLPGAASPLLASVVRMIYHSARGRDRSLEPRLARTVEPLDRFHRYLHDGARGKLFLASPDDERVLSGEEPRCQDIEINALLIQAETDLADIAIHTGFPSRSIISRRTRLSMALNNRLWNADRRIFLSRSDDGWLPLTSAGMLPMWSGAALGEQARAMVAEYLIEPRGFMSGSPVATVTDAEGPPGAPQRGPIDPILNWLLVRGTYRYGFEDLAGRIEDATLLLAAEQGLFESYSAVSGDGIGAADSVVTAAVALDLLKSPHFVERW